MPIRYIRYRTTQDCRNFGTLPGREIGIEGDGVHDLIVVGAGPAGSAAAREAARRGLDTLVLEKETFPRYKPCGGAISDRALSLLDFALPEDLCERTITGARVHFHGRVMEKHKGYRLTTLVTRSRFDDFLLQKAKEAGANLAVEKVLDFREHGDHVEVLTRKNSYRSRFLVIASGCQDPLKERVRGRTTRESYGVCMVAEVEEEERRIEERLHGSLDIYFGVADMGYGWIFPHRGYYSVGIGGLASRLKHPRRAMENFIRSNGFAEGQRLHGHLIPFGGWGGRIATNRVLLAGDSADFVDAFTGEGIYYSLCSGQIAARAVSEQPDPEVAGSYQSLCKEDFGDELRYARLFSWIMHSYPKIFFRILTCHEEVLDRYIEIAAARKTYRDFIRWLVPRLPISLLRTL